MTWNQTFGAWGRIWAAVLAPVALSVLDARGAEATNHVVFSAGVATPVSGSKDFAEDGQSYELRWRHFNRGRSAFEFVGGYMQSGLTGEVKRTIDDFEQLVRLKNSLAQQQGGPGAGSLTAEFGTLEILYFNTNYVYRIIQRTRFAPFVSAGAGVYNWSVPFRLKFFNVPSFGEQQPWLSPAPNRFYSFVFRDEKILDFTKNNVSGGLNLAVGGDVRLSRSWNLQVEARSHLILSSGSGNREEGADDQDYLNDMTFVLLQGLLAYRF